MSRPSNSAIIASFMALRVSVRLRERVPILSRLCYNTALSTMLELLMYVSLKRMQNRQQQLFESATHRGCIDILLHGMRQCSSRDPQTHCRNAQAKREIGVRARGTDHRWP